MYRHARLPIRLTAALAATAASLPAQATIFTYDSSQGAYVVPAGSYSSLADIYADNITAINNGSFNVTASGSLSSAIIASSSNPGSGASSGTVAFVDNQPVVFNLNSPSNGGIAIYVHTQGGAGSNSKPPQTGGSAGAISTSINATSVTINASATPTNQMFGVYTQSYGAKGGDSNNKNNDNGANGGAAGGITFNVTGSTLAATAPSVNAGSATAEVSQVAGAGGSGLGHTTGGTGGDALASAVVVTNSRVSASGTNLAALSIDQTGGAGGPASPSDSNGTGGGGGGAKGVTVQLSGSAISTSGANADAFRLTQTGGAGGQADTSSTAGVGGIAGPTTAQVTDTSITAAGSNARGFAILQTGGAGGSGDNADNKDRSNGNTGGAASGIAVTLTGQATGVAVTTSGSGAGAIQALSAGGAGGNGADTGGAFQSGINSGNGGTGGTAGTVAITTAGPVTVKTQGDNASGVLALSQGGAGGYGGMVTYATNSTPGDAGAGGAASAVAVTLGTGTSVATAGTGANAVTAQSLGGAGNHAGDINTTIGAPTGHAGGAGGDSGLVMVNLGASTLTTSGSQSNGLLVQSVSGAGGRGSEVVGGFKADGGTGGAGGTAGGLVVNSAATITTGGSQSRGILAQTLSGGGGGGGSANNLFSANGGAGGTSGLVMPSSVTNTGTVTTSGAGAEGILLQGIAGGGGVGGNVSGFIYSIGGAGGTDPANSNGGNLGIVNNGSVTTKGDGSGGVVAQSVGGGGGAGGSVSGLVVNVGGSGNGGGTGGTIAASGTGSISTSGSLSNGFLAQSVGGGGGTGGNSTGVSVGASVSIGGKAGSGGDGGAVAAALGAMTITTTGSGSSGLVAQSVGGGGGTGGAAYALSATPVASFAAAVGGSGGAGGSGGYAGAGITGGSISTGRAVTATTTPPIDSVGILAQSIGGGGGVGGGASAAAVAIAIPTGPEGTSSTLTGVYAAGGSGGSGGAGGNAFASVSTGSQVTTAGAGSIGVLSQSIGGGGGQGGDSSAFAATIGYVPNVIPTEPFGTQAISVSVAVGGSGGSGGAGGAASANLGTNNPPDVRSGVFSTINTTGDGANGLVAQSVGGGGGNAGLGSARLGSAGKVSTLGATLTLGATGGKGGAGGSASAFVDPDGIVKTTGSGASGVVVQSIGGGGGTSTGGALNLSGIKDIKVGGPLSVSPSIRIALGATGGAGGNGGTAMLIHQGTITTVGNDAPGAIVQSIGGGGGIGGAAGTDTAATGDATEPATTTKTTQAAAADPSLSVPSVTLDLKTSVSLGGSGGSAGNGGAVTVSLPGAYITTSGDYSPGLVAQSVGGGGGRGGSAVAGGEDNSLKSFITGLTYNSTLSLGATAGGNGSAGDGGPVNATLYGTVKTGLRGQGSAGTGFQSFGVLAQSVGGGGGIASDGTPDPSGQLMLGAGLGSTSGATGNGGAVTVQEGSAQLHAYTYGDAAHAVVLQSVGGGGGVGGAGGTITGPAIYASTVTTSLGGALAHGNGGNVNLNFVTINPVTTGNGAFGILAQSVGGGGGLATLGNSPTTTPYLAILGGGNGNGGAVTLYVGSNSTTTTSGVGSHAIVAQSVGGGGGIYQVVPAAGATPGLTFNRTLVPVQDGFGSGGDVTVTSLGNVTASGNGAIGILAQSVGGGGGIATVGNQTFLGSTGSVNPYGGKVEVDVSKSVSATGVNGIGVFAQSSGGLNPVVVNLTNATVQGGSGPQGAGIMVRDFGGTVSLDKTSTVSALSGMAVTGGGSSGPLNVANAGTITGSMNLGSGTVSGSGTLVPVGASVITGNVALSQGATITPAADFAAGTSGSYRILGNAVFAGGTIRPALANVVANVRLPVLTVTGSTTGTLTATSSALFDFTLQPVATSSGLRFDLSAVGGHFADTRFALSPGRAAVATGLQSLFSAGSMPFGGFFADLDAVASAQPGEYARRLAQLGPRSTLTVGARRAADAAGIANASMSCPVFSDAYTGAAAFLTEGSCAYFKPGVRTTSQGGDADRGHLQLDSATWQVGGQQEVLPGLFLGGSLAYERSWLSADDGVKGSGSSGQGAATLKYQTGPVLLTAAAFGTVGGTDLQRVVSIPGIGGVAKGSPANQSAGLRARAAYTVGTESLYVRPYLNVDGIYAHTGAYREYGTGSYGLAYDGASQTTAVFTPAVELGGRMVLGPSTVLRSFVSVGASVRTNDQWRATARLVGSPAGAGGFGTVVPQDRAAARVSAGLQLFQGERVDLRAQYDGDYSGRTESHGGSLTFAWRL